jgi:hypothetical protein
MRLGQESAEIEICVESGQHETEGVCEMPLLSNDGEVLLEPGDILMVQHMLIGGNAAQTALAIHQIKQTLANDSRFNYQGSEIVKETYSDNSELELLNIYVQMRKTPREQKQETQVGTIPQEANALWVIVVPVSLILGLMYAAKISQDATIVFRLWVLNGIVKSNMSAAEQRVAIAAINKTNSSVGESVKAIGEGMTIVGITVLLLGGLWLLRRKGSRPKDLP